MSEQLNESDFSILHDDLHEAVNRLGEMEKRLEQLVASHNSVGENVAWLVANTQGIFQMFNSPEMMNQMMGMVLGGGHATGPAGPAEGT